MQSHTFICLIITTCILLSVDINAFILASSSKVTQQQPQCSGSNSYSDIRCGALIDDTINDDNIKQQRFILSPQTITSWYMNKLHTHELNKVHKRCNTCINKRFICTKDRTLYESSYINQIR